MTSAAAADLLQRTVQWLRSERSAHPGRSILFPELQPASLRRQVVRWIDHEYDAPTPGILEVLRSALADRDWEVRCSAMLTAARLHAVTLRHAVGEVALPGGGEYGLSDADAQYLLGIRVLAEALLGASASREEALVRIAGNMAPLDLASLGLVRGHHPAPRTAQELLIHALVTPVALVESLPELPAAGVTLRDDRAWLGASDCELRWIPAGRYLLSAGGRAGASVGDAPDETTFVHGFWVSRRLLSLSDLAACGAGDEWLVADDPAAGDIVVSADVAAQQCAALSRALGTHVRLPTTLELRAAMFGNDGRRFPWGNSPPRRDDGDRSPFGLDGAMASTPQWVDRGASAGRSDLARRTNGAEVWAASPVPGRPVVAALRAVISHER